MNGGIKPVRPPWPVRPMTPAPRDREPGQRKKQPQPPQGSDGDDDERHSTIDEYI